MHRLTTILLALLIITMPALAMAQDVAIPAEAVEDAIRDGLGLPLLGLAAVLLAMLVARIKDSVPLKDQAIEALKAAKRPFVAGVATAGLALMLGQSAIDAVAGGAVVLLAMTNFLRSRGGKAESKESATTIRYVFEAQGADDVKRAFDSIAESSEKASKSDKAAP